MNSVYSCPQPRPHLPRPPLVSRHVAVLAQATFTESTGEQVARGGQVVGQDALLELDGDRRDRRKNRDGREVNTREYSGRDGIMLRMVVLKSLARSVGVVKLWRAGRVAGCNDSNGSKKLRWASRLALVFTHSWSHHSRNRSIVSVPLSGLYPFRRRLNYNLTAVPSNSSTGAMMKGSA